MTEALLQKDVSCLFQTLPKEQENYYSYFLSFQEKRVSIFNALLKMLDKPHETQAEEIHFILSSPHRRCDFSKEDQERLFSCLEKLESTSEPVSYSLLYLAAILYLPLHKMPQPVPARLMPWLAPFLSTAIKGQAMISVTDDQLAMRAAMKWVQSFATNMHEAALAKNLLGSDDIWDQFWLPLFGFDITTIDYYSTNENLASFVKLFGKFRSEAFDLMSLPPSKLTYRVVGDLDKTKGARTRVALLCSHITSHGHGLPHLLWWITCIDKERFEILVIIQETATNADSLARLIDRYDVLSNLAPFVIIPANAFDSVKDLDIDILYNMDDLCRGRSELSAYKRMAHHQVTGFYTPATTGCTKMDYYITSPDLDPYPDNAFTEKVIMSKGLPFCFHFESYFGVKPNLDREILGIDKNQLIITMGSSMTTKVRPEFVIALVKILKQVPDAICLAMPIDPQKTRPHLVELFIKVCNSYDVDPERIKFLPFASREFLHGVIKLSDLFLDFFPFSGTNNLLDPLMLGTPCISLCPPDGYSRNRIGSSILRSMNLDECIADNEEDYINLAVKLCQNKSLRDSLSKRMGKKAMEISPLCDGPSYVRRMESVFDEIMSYKRRSL